MHIYNSDLRTFLQPNSYMKKLRDKCFPFFNNWKKSAKKSFIFIHFIISKHNLCSLLIYMLGDIILLLETSLEI